MNTAGLLGCTTLPSSSSWARASVQAKGRVPVKSLQASNFSSCGQPSSNFQEGRANGTFFCSENLRLLVCFLFVCFYMRIMDRTAGNGCIGSSIHQSVFLELLLNERQQGTKQMERTSPMPCGSFNPLTFKVRKLKPSAFAGTLPVSHRKQQSCRILPTPFHRPQEM